MTGKPRGAQAVDELDLVGGRDVRALVLQPVARSDFDDGDSACGVYAELHQRRVGLHELALAAAHRGDDAVAERADRQLHLHRFEHDDDVAFLHRVAGLDVAL